MGKRSIHGFSFSDIGVTCSEEDDHRKSSTARWLDHRRKANRPQDVTQYILMHSDFSKELQVFFIHLLDWTTLHASPKVVVGSVWSNDPESYAGGSVAVFRVTLAGQVKVDDPD